MKTFYLWLDEFIIWVVNHILAEGFQLWKICSSISTFQSKKSNATISTTINIWEKIIFRFRATNKGILFPSTTMIAHVPLIKNISMIVTSLFTCDKNVKVLKYIIFIDNLTYIKRGSGGGDNTLGLCLFEYRSTNLPWCFTSSYAG